MKFPERSALVIVLQVENIQAQFQLKSVSHFTSTKFLSPLVVFPATAAQTKLLSLITSQNETSHK